MRTILVCAAVAAVFATGAQARSACPAGLHAVTTAELFFGAEVRGGGEISDADWQAFLAAEVTPRFPEGLTTWDADGRWRAPSGVQTHEKSRVLLLVMSGQRNERARLDALIDAYKTRYHQLSVGLVENADCARF
ncbi:MAG TPA: DUF3574 domain-containing protein [Caulobacteraceae bacterium]|jgi:hypothetical protein|nr:DUF3574 domain-containing protein [Caulobacteraceae bacterium]